MIAPQHVFLHVRETQKGGNSFAVAMKTSTNLSLAVQLLAFKKGFLSVDKSGFRQVNLVDVLPISVIALPTLKYRRPFNRGFSDDAWLNVSTMHKELDLALELIQQVNGPMPTKVGTNEARKPPSKWVC